MNKKSITSIKIITLCFLLFIVFIQLQEGYTDPILEDLKRQMTFLDPDFINVSLNEGNKSYTINKSKIYLCLKDKNGRYYSRNMLMYVLLHEYSHKICDEIGHTPKFYQIFNNVLKEASKKGIWNPNIKPEKNYCGHN